MAQTWAIHQLRPNLLNIVVLAVADSLLSLCGLERVDELFISSPPPPPPRP